MQNTTLVLAIITVSFIAAAWSNAQVANSAIQEPIAQPTPSNKFTAADIAKLKWIEGTWRAVLEWPATPDKPARQKIYIMEPWKP